MRFFLLLFHDDDRQQASVSSLLYLSCSFAICGLSSITDLSREFCMHKLQSKQRFVFPFLRFTEIQRRDLLMTHPGTCTRHFPSLYPRSSLTRRIFFPSFPAFLFLHRIVRKQRIRVSYHGKMDVRSTRYHLMDADIKYLYAAGRRVPYV